MKKTSIAILVALLSFAGLANADILPEGQKVVPVCASFSNTADVLDTMAIYGYETDPAGDKVDFSSFIANECFKPAYKFNTLKIYGVTAAHALETDLENYDPSADTEAYPSNIDPEMGYMYVPDTSDLMEVRNVYEIVELNIEDGVLIIRPLHTAKLFAGSTTPEITEGVITMVSGGEQSVTQETEEETQEEDTSIFTDVDSTSTYYNALVYLKDNGIVSGYPDGSFKPDSKINRAELSKIIVEAAFEDDDITNCMAHYVSQSTTIASLFTDVAHDLTAGTQAEWYMNYVCIGKLHGFIDGYPDGSFKPAQNINFVEAAKIITEGWGAEMSESEPWYKTYVEELEDGNAIPTTITTFAKEITRGEMAEIIYRLKANITTLPSQAYADLS